MKQYKIVRDSDGNDFFYIEARNREHALYDALQQLGWYCLESADVDEDDDSDDTLYGIAEEFLND